MSVAVPAAPVFLFDPKDHWIDLWETPKTTLTTVRFLGPKRFEFSGYDANLAVWTVRWNTPELSLWGRITNLGGRSQIDVPVQWAEAGKYKIGKLRQNFIEAVLNDDDKLTQFVEREELIRRLGQCDSFADFTQAWEWLSHDPG